MGTTLPLFQSSGRMPVESDCAYIKHRNGAMVSWMFFNTFELISSTPPDEDNFIFWITHEMPSAQKTIEHILDDNSTPAGWEGTPDSLVNTDENAVLKASAHWLSESAWPDSLVRWMVLVDRGLTICQNFRVLSVSMPGKSLFKNVYFALQIAVVYSFSAVLYFAQASGVSFTFALRKRRFFSIQ